MGAGLVTKIYWFLQFSSWCPFSVLGSSPGSYITYSCCVSLISSGLSWFLRLSLSFTTLKLLMNAGQLSRSIYLDVGLSGVFSWWDETACLGLECHRRTPRFSQSTMSSLQMSIYPLTADVTLSPYLRHCGPMGWVSPPLLFFSLYLRNIWDYTNILFQFKHSLISPTSCGFGLHFPDN